MYVICICWLTAHFHRGRERRVTAALWSPLLIAATLVNESISTGRAAERLSSVSAASQERHTAAAALSLRSAFITQRFHYAALSLRSAFITQRFHYAALSLRIVLFLTKRAAAETRQFKQSRPTGQEVK